MSSATENGRISLTDNLQHKWFTDAMKVLDDNKLRLSEYDAGLFEDLRAAYQLAGRDLTITRRQMNHIKSVAFDFEKGC